MKNNNEKLLVIYFPNTIQHAPPKVGLEQSFSDKSWVYSKLALPAASSISLVYFTCCCLLITSKSSSLKMINGIYQILLLESWNGDRLMHLVLPTTFSSPNWTRQKSTQEQQRHTS